MKSLSWFAGLFVLLTCHAALAAYPERPVTIVVPYAAGGPTDVAGRLVAQELSNRLKASFVVDNRVGAGGNIGAAFVAKSAPNGYTLLMLGIAHSINKSLYKNLNYDIEHDFAPVALMTTAPLLLLASPKTPVSSVRDLVALAKSSSSPLSYMSQGIGSAPHITMELLRTKAGMPAMTHIPYKGSAPALSDLMGGQVNIGFDSLVVGQPLVTSGKLKALAITGQSRAAALPDVPTMIEAGYPDADSTVWYGVAAPAGTPADIVSLLSRHIVDALESPEVRARIAGLGARATPLGPQEFQRFLAAEIRKWAEAVRQSGATAE